MEKEFVPYELALRMNQLGFDEPCLANWNFYIDQLIYNGNPSTFSSEDVLQLPLFQQAFGWFREKHGAVCEIIRKEDRNHSEFIGWIYIDNKKIDVTSYWASKKYEEAELACLQKLIEIVEKLKSE